MLLSSVCDFSVVLASIRGLLVYVPTIHPYTKSAIVPQLVVAWRTGCGQSTDVDTSCLFVEVRVFDNIRLFILLFEMSILLESCPRADNTWQLLHPLLA